MRIELGQLPDWRLEDGVVTMGGRGVEVVLDMIESVDARDF